MLKWLGGIMAHLLYSSPQPAWLWRLCCPLQARRLYSGKGAERSQFYSVCSNKRNKASIVTVGRIYEVWLILCILSGTRNKWAKPVSARQHIVISNVIKCILQIGVQLKHRVSLSLEKLKLWALLKSPVMTSHWCQLLSHTSPPISIVHVCQYHLDIDECFFPYFPGHTSCVLVGHGWGGMLAWYFTMEHLDKVQCLVIMNPASWLGNVIAHMGRCQMQKHMQCFFPVWLSTFDVHYCPNVFGSQRDYELL